MHEGRRFELERRSVHAAIYRQIHLKYGLIAYEVHIIRHRPARPGWGNSAGRVLEACEQLASNAEFGKWAWSFGGPNKRGLSLEKFDALQEVAAPGAPSVASGTEPP